MVKSPISLPLFPLNFVFYPSISTLLHIFEPRYKAMMNRCLDKQEPFGIVLLADGVPEGNTDLKLYSPIGTTARIVQVQKLDQGRMNLWVVGEQRFKLIDWSMSVDDYLIGEAYSLDDAYADPLLFRQEMTDLKPKLEDYINLLVELNQGLNRKTRIEYQLAEDPNRISYQVAMILDISFREKQSLLEMDDLKERLVYENTLLDREIERLNQFVQARKAAKTQSLPWGGAVHLN